MPPPIRTSQIPPQESFTMNQPAPQQSFVNMSLPPSSFTMNQPTPQQTFATRPLPQIEFPHQESFTMNQPTPQQTFATRPPSQIPYQESFTMNQPVTQQTFASMPPSQIPHQESFTMNQPVTQQTFNRAPSTRPLAMPTVQRDRGRTMSQIVPSTSSTFGTSRRRSSGGIHYNDAEESERVEETESDHGYENGLSPSSQPTKPLFNALLGAVGSLLVGEPAK